MNKSALLRLFLAQQNHFFILLRSKDAWFSGVPPSEDMISAWWEKLTTLGEIAQCALMTHLLIEYFSTVDSVAQDVLTLRWGLTDGNPLSEREIVACRETLRETLSEGYWLQNMLHCGEEGIKANFLSTLIPLKTTVAQNVDLTVTSLDLPQRAINCVRRVGVTNIPDLARLWYIIPSARGLGNGSLQDVREYLIHLGYTQEVPDLETFPDLSDIVFPTSRPLWQLGKPSRYVGVYQIANRHPYHYSPRFLYLNNLPEGLIIDLGNQTWSLDGHNTRSMGVRANGHGWSRGLDNSCLGGVYDLQNILHVQELIATCYDR